ncbi:MAG TPA: GNAT family N-acetyltransferase [Wenzhouxiangella sp.]|nr:GNAT family N-acetyltransferase [Wenzhouxiangella sp.]
MIEHGQWVVRLAREDDAPGIVEIYNHYVEHSTATFEEQLLNFEQMQSRMAAVVRSGLPWLVAERDAKVQGYAYAAPWRERTAYRHSVEVTAYVHPNQAREGMGSGLYTALVERLACTDIHSLIGVVTLPNPASAAFHERMGFVQVAHLKEVGYKFGRWLDVGYFQRLLANNRSF